LSFKIDFIYIEKVYSLLDKYQNISIFTYGEFFHIDLYLVKEESNLKKLKNLKRIFGSYRSSVISNKNFIKNNNEKKSVESQLFFITSGEIKKPIIKKYNLLITSKDVFGTGSHESTFLLIRQIEMQVKKRSFFNVLDLGTGTGILSFILRKLIYGKVMASDIDKSSKNNFFYNLKKNNLNNIFFQLSNGFKNKHFNGKKYDLIVSNMLLSCQIKMLTSYFRNLKNKGLLLISGILKQHENEIIAKFSKYKLILKEKLYMENWVSLIFVKKSF
tara:strand:+ start:2403 stop:3221 length:819 start_codon:yes stop_codon:yes gene_type:complete